MGKRAGSKGPARTGFVLLFLESGVSGSKSFFRDCAPGGLHNPPRKARHTDTDPRLPPGPSATPESFTSVVSRSERGPRSRWAAGVVTHASGSSPFQSNDSRGIPENFPPCVCDPPSGGLRDRAVGSPHPPPGARYCAGDVAGERGDRPAGNDLLAGTRRGSVGRLLRDGRRGPVAPQPLRGRKLQGARGAPAGVRGCL